MAWVNIIKSNYMSVTMMDDIYDNMVEINTALSNLELSPVDLEDSRVYYSISPAEILDQMNTVERNIQALHNTLFYICGGQDKYFSVFLWQATTQNRKARVDRWIDWLNDIHDTVTSLSEEALSDASGEPVTDINGEPIYTIERNLSYGNI